MGTITENARILLVDNEPSEVELITLGLAEGGLANIVDVVRDANACLDYLFKRGTFADRQTGYPLVILLDLKLPGVDGRELLKQLKTMERISCIPVVVLTGSQYEEDIIKTYAYGANSYVIKPIDIHGLFEKIKALGLYWTVVSEPPPVEKCVLVERRVKDRRVAA